MTETEGVVKPLRLPEPEDPSTGLTGYGATPRQIVPRYRQDALCEFADQIEIGRHREIKDEFNAFHPESDKIDDFKDAMTYDANSLTSLALLTKTSGTVWKRRKLWTMAGQLFAMSFVIALLVLLIVRDPASLQISKFAKISTFLNVFVGLLLGFFMSSSIVRWYNCASGFLKLFDAIRCLQVQFYSLGVEEDKMDDCLRYALLSAWLLSMQLRVDVQSPEERPDAIEKMWKAIRANAENEGTKTIFKGLSEEDEQHLRKVHDPSQLIWIWVSNIIGRLAQDGDIPPLASPTYGRIMGLAENGHSGIREVRASVSVQAPYIYVQVLAALVHINNLVNALSFGMTWGSSLGTTMSAFHALGYGKGNSARMSQVAQDTQNVIVSFFLSCFGPFVYVALLEVAIAIAQPFCSKDGEIPTRRMLIKLENDLNDAQNMAHNMPKKWPRPYFKSKS